MYSRKELIAHYQKKSKIKMIFFWKPLRSKVLNESCLSQWYPAKFKDNNTLYTSAEQYMMAEKAKLFDITYFDKIINAKTAKEVKQLGRKIQNFDEKIWIEKSFDIVIKGNYLKFKQNHELNSYLLSTKNKILVEASPYDKIWGIGLLESDKHAKNPLIWKGENKLGFALMKVRDMLITKES